MGRPGTRTKLLTRDIASGPFLVHPGRPIRRSLLSRGGKLYPGYYAYSDSKIGTRSGSGRNLSLRDCREGTSLAVFSREGVSWLAWWGAGKSHSCVLLSNQRVWSCEFRSPPIVSVKSSNRHQMNKLQEQRDFESLIVHSVIGDRRDSDASRGCTAGCDAEDVRDDCVEDLRDPRLDLPHQTSSQSSCSEISKQLGQQNKDIYSAVSRRLFWPELPKCMENGHDRSIYIFPVPLTHQVRWYLIFRVANGLEQ